jgi:hypothetical protein
MNNAIFVELLRVLDASLIVQHRNIFLFVDSCASCAQNRSFLWKVKFNYNLLNFTSFDSFREDWIWIDNVKDVDFIYTASVDSELATLCFSGVDKL